MEAKAKHRNCPMSPRKVRLVADTVRGMEVNKALNSLKFTRKFAANYIEKVLTSAVANWQQKTQQDAAEHDLVIKTLLIDEAQMLKRFRPAPYGRAHRIRKRSCHITIVVENVSELSETSVIETEEEIKVEA